MIAGHFHAGSGLGDQLFRYITVRTLALDKGYEWGMVNPRNFKGQSFMKLDMGKDVAALDWEYGITPSLPNRFEEKKVTENGVDIRSYDPEINFVQDNTVIDGNFEDEKYWGHRLDEIREWLKVEPVTAIDDVCVINFRGGEYAAIPELFLGRGYWDEAVRIMRQINPKMRFDVHTDDPYTAKRFFPDFNIWDNQMVTADKQYTHMGFNWRSIRYAKHLILANSAFGILPALLNDRAEKVIAPRYWARRNTKVWARPACYYRKFTYI